MITFGISLGPTVISKGCSDGGASGDGGCCEADAGSAALRRSWRSFESCLAISSKLGRFEDCIQAGRKGEARALRGGAPDIAVADGVKTLRRWRIGEETAKAVRGDIVPYLRKGQPVMWVGRRIVLKDLLGSEMMHRVYVETKGENLRANLPCGRC